MMNYRKLGRTGFSVSEIGFGAWGIGGAKEGSISYGPTDDEESRKALHSAFDRGITFYDTADLYGHGHSEFLIGDVFKSIRDQVIIASKGGLLDQSGHQDFSPEHIRRSLEGSLKRLQSDYIDLYQLHDPSLEFLKNEPEVFETLYALEKEGKIRSWGISVRSPDDGLTAVKRFQAKVVQVNFNMVDQRMVANGLMDLCCTNEIGLIARTPLCFGFLTGMYSEGTKFGTHDHRSLWSFEQKTLWLKAQQIFSEIRDEDHQTESQFALRYCLSYPSLSTAIPGMLCDKHVEENINAARLGPLSEVQRKKIESVYRTHTFYAGEKAVLKP